jgi:hypothetical protein
MRIPYTGPVPSPQILPPEAKTLSGTVNALVKLLAAGQGKTVLLTGAGISVAVCSLLLLLMTLFLVMIGQVDEHIFTLVEILAYHFLLLHSPVSMTIEVLQEPISSINRTDQFTIRNSSHHMNRANGIGLGVSWVGPIWRRRNLVLRI